MACEHQWIGQQDALLHELVCARCGRLGAAVSRLVAERMEQDEEFRAFVWREIGIRRPSR